MMVDICFLLVNGWQMVDSMISVSEWLVPDRVGGHLMAVLCKIAYGYEQVLEKG